MGGMRVLRLALLWILKAQMLSVEVFGEEIPAHQEMVHALVTVPDPRGEKETRRTMKWEMRGSREVRWREGSCWQEGKSRHSQGKDPRTFEGHSKEKGPTTFQERGHKEER